MRHTPQTIRAYKIATVPYNNVSIAQYPVAQRLENDLAKTAINVTGHLPNALLQNDEDERQIFLAPFYNATHKSYRDNKGTIADPVAMLDESPQECANTLSQPLIFAGRVFINREDAFQFGKVEIMQNWFMCNQNRFDNDVEKKRFVQLLDKLQNIADAFLIDETKLLAPQTRVSYKKNIKAVNEFFDGEFAKLRVQYPDEVGKTPTPNWQDINYTRMKAIWLTYGEQYPTFKQLMLDMWRHRILPIADSPTDSVWGLGDQFSNGDPAKLLLSKVFFECVSQWSSKSFTIDEADWRSLTAAISNLLLQSNRAKGAYLQTVCQEAFSLPIFYGNYPHHKVFVPTLVYSPKSQFKFKKNKTVEFPTELAADGQSTLESLVKTEPNDSAAHKMCRTILKDFAALGNLDHLEVIFACSKTTTVKFIFLSPLIASNFADRLTHTLGIPASSIKTEKLIDYSANANFTVSITTPTHDAFSRLCELYHELPSLFPNYAEVLLHLLDDIKNAGHNSRYRSNCAIFLDLLQQETRNIHRSFADAKQGDNEDDDDSDSVASFQTLEEFILENVVAPDYFKARASALDVQYPSQILGNVDPQHRDMIDGIIKRYACPTEQAAKALPFERQMHQWLIHQANETRPASIPITLLAQWDYTTASPKLMMLTHSQRIEGEQTSVAVSTSSDMLSLVGHAAETDEGQLQRHFAIPNPTQDSQNSQHLPNLVAACTVIDSLGTQLADAHTGVFLTRSGSASHSIATPLHQVTISDIDFNDAASCAVFVNPDKSPWEALSALFGKKPTQAPTLSSLTASADTSASSSSSSSSSSLSSSSSSSSSSSAAAVANAVVPQAVAKPFTPGLDQEKYYQYALAKYQLVLNCFARNNVKHAVLKPELTGDLTSRYYNAICDIKANAIFRALIDQGQRNQKMQVVLITASVATQSGKTDDKFYTALNRCYATLSDADKACLPEVIIIANCRPQAGVPILRQYFVEANISIPMPVRSRDIFGHASDEDEEEEKYKDKVKDAPPARDVSQFNLTMPVPVIGEMIADGHIAEHDNNWQSRDANSTVQNGSSLTTRLFTQTSMLNPNLQLAGVFQIEGKPELARVPTHQQFA